MHCILSQPTTSNNNLTIDSADILGATQALVRPYWPLLKSDVYLTPDIRIGPIKTLGGGFRDLVAFGIDDTAYGVLKEMAGLTSVIDCHCRGIRPISDIALYIDSRNAVQHRLMSLVTADELGVADITSACLYESIRHAAIIYSAAVTFPVPSYTGIFGQLGSWLRGILEESKVDMCWQLFPKALLWVLVLGGIASSGTAERTWYVQNIAAVTAALKLDDWPEISRELENYLWLESSCDTGGQLLWTEVLNDRLLVGGNTMEAADGLQMAEQLQAGIP